MNKKSKFVIYCVALLIICTAVYFVLRPRDFYDLTYDNFVTVPFDNPELESMLAEKSVTGSETDYMGVILKTVMFDLKKGDYNVVIRYSNTGAANSCELYSPNYISMTNEPEKVFVKQALDITQNGETAFSFSFDKPAEYLEFRIIYTGGDIHIDSIEITKDGVYYTDAFFAALIIAFFGAIAIYLYVKDDKKSKPDAGRFGLSRLQIYLLCLAVALVATLPMFRESIIDTHDGFFHLARIEGIAKALSQGQFPVRINSDFAAGKGFAEPVMYPGLFMYIPGLMMLFGSSQMFAYISICLFTNIATALIAYYCFKRLLHSDFMGFTAAVFYMFALYRIVNLYTRGALGEFIAMAFLPLVILGMYEIVYGNEKKYKYLVLGFCGLLGSHILSVIICFLFCAAFVLCNLKKVFKKQRLVALGKSAGLTILLNLWFLIPLFSYYQIGLRLFDTHYISEHRVRIPQLFQTFVIAYGGSEFLTDTSAPEMSLSVGGILASACLIYIFFVWKMRRNKDMETARLFKIGNYSLAFSAAALIISSTLFPWDFIYNIPVLGSFLTIVQFPWRYLMVATVFMCVVAAIAVYYMARNIKRKNICTAAVLALSMLALTPYFYNYYTIDLLACIQTKYETKYDTASPADYFYPETDAPLLYLTGHGIKSSVSGISYDGYYKNGAYLHFVYNATNVADGDYIDVPLYCYPGYRVLYNDTELLTAHRGENDVIRIYLPEGATSGSIKVKYTGLWYFYIGDAVTAATIIAIAVIPVVRRRQNTRRENGAKKRQLAEN